MKARPLISLVPEVGLEPTRRLDPRGILSPVRLPIPPLRHQSVAEGSPAVFYAISFMLSRDASSRRGPYHTAKLIRCQGGTAQDLRLLGKLAFPLPAWRAEREAHLPLLDSGPL
jgi:hypothetical protein